MPNVLRARVEVFNLDNDETTNSRVINYNNKDHCDWLHKTIIWAMFNNHGIEITRDQPIDSQGVDP